MIDIPALRRPHTIVCLGNYRPVVQSILNFD